MLNILCILSKSGDRRQNRACDIAESDSVSITFTPAGDAQRVSIFEPLPRFAAWQRERIRAAPG
jgi:hypothetical protein